MLRNETEKYVFKKIKKNKENPDEFPKLGLTS
jgi:hypothetical protein